MDVVIAVLSTESAIDATSEAGLAEAASDTVPETNLASGDVQVTEIGTEPVVEAPPVEPELPVPAPLDVLAAEVLPLDVTPADVLPLDVTPADVLPLEVVPVDVLPDEALPFEVAPVDVTPVEVAPVEVLLAELAPVVLVDADADPLAPALRITHTPLTQ